VVEAHAHGDQAASGTGSIEHAGDGGGPVLFDDACERLAAKIDAISPRLKAEDSEP
jgi:hypothetical protein